MNIFETLEALRNTNSPIEKVQIMKDCYDPLTLQWLMKATYNSLVTYGIKATAGNGAQGETLSFEESVSAIQALLSKLAKRELTGHAARGALYELMWDLSEHWREVLEGILDRDLRIGLGVTLINKAFPGLIPEFELMVCHTLDEKTEQKLKFPCYVQLKYDAARVAVIVEGKNVTFMTRNGKTYQLSNPVLGIELLGIAGGEDWVFDGELYIAKDDGTPEPRKISNGIANKLIRGTASQDEMDKVRIALWDMVPKADFEAGHSPIVYRDRWALLTDSIETAGAVLVHAAETLTCNNIREVYTESARRIKDGYEGVIVKNLDGVWQAKRVYDCLKVKAVREADLRIVALEEGTKKNVGKLGAFVLQSEDGLVNVNVGTGFSDAQRVAFWDQSLVGKIVSMQYNELITDSNGNVSMFLPRFVEIREDKNDADTLDKIKAGT